MEPKGIDIPGLIPTQGTSLKADRKSAPSIRPVVETKEGELKNLLETNRETQKGLFSLTEKDAKNATEMLNAELKDVPNVEVDWKFNRDAGVLVVFVKDKNTGRVLREIPPEQVLEILSGDSHQGLIIDRKA
ncbi:hypothetical protein DBT_1104 [Dissulfuribacter thermophilus]|uniref:Flagellin protein FlaG n=1 Tax=Dissulfuribacter thermophilus TaxID=1156395 RepID=A0A1B9F5Z0_9BACT|nr:flagellar protein FlaG [Dissulfuribacter thermophilus]OCC15357.1 hypothetical protein DBT_1104 [Dissulfuribacter thermophilus]